MSSSFTYSAFAVPCFVGAPRVDRVHGVLAHHAGRRVVALHREVRDVVEVGGREPAVRQRAGALERHEALQQTEMAALLQDAGHVVSHDARLRVRDDDRAAEPLDERRQVLRRPGVGGRDLLRIAGIADRAGQRHLRVRHQLLVVLERVGLPAIRPAPARWRRRATRSSRPRESSGNSGATCWYASGCGFGSAGSPCGISLPVRIVEFAGTRWPNQFVHAPSSVIRPKPGIMSAPPLVSPADHLRFALVNHRLVEARAAAAGLIDDVARNALADEVGIPAFAAVRRRFEARAGVARAVHHDHRPAAAYFFAGIWNCTYIWPMVIWCGASGWFGGGAAPPGT